MFETLEKYLTPQLFSFKKNLAGDKKSIMKWKKKLAIFELKHIAHSYTREEKLI